MKAKVFFLFYALFLIGLTTGYAQAPEPRVERVEPPFWWVGMQDPQLQLMVYGENIGHTRPAIDHPGLRLEQVIQVESPNYLFLNLLIEEDAAPGAFEIRFMAGTEVALTQSYELRARQPGSAQRKGFDQSDVLYLITPDRFVNAVPDNDEMAGLAEGVDRRNPGGRHGGDIEGIISSLDYLKDMGFTAIWINPVLENDQPTYSYHGYSTTDFYRVDPRYGTNEDYLRLSKVAEEKGIKLIMDMILNHCGSEHWWMDDLPTADWINFSGEFVPTNHRRTVIQDPHASEWDTRHFSDGWFVETMPDLNQRNPLLATYLTQNSVWWVEYAGLEGIRMDTYPYPDKTYMSDWTCRMMEEYPNLNIVGEEWTNNPALVSHWQRGKLNPNGYVSCLPSLMDFPIQETMRVALNEEEEAAAGKGWVKLYRMLANDFLYPDPDNLVVFPDNHDMSRFFTQVNEDLGLFKLGLAYTLTIRGIPQIYYGTEVLMKNPGTTAHGIIRSDFPGGWAGDAANAFTGEGLTAEQRDAQAFVKKLLTWRQSAEVIHHGKTTHFAPVDGVYVVFRHYGDDKVMVLLNKAASETKLSLYRYAELLNNVRKGRDVISGKTVTLDQTLTVPARSPMILELE